MTPVIQLQHVGVCFSSDKSLFSKSEHWALKDISFTINSGETLGIVGRNGAGKSTLLKLLADIIIPNQGAIIREKNSRCSLLTLQLGFNSFLTGRENAIISGMFLGASREHMEQSLEAINHFSGLGDAFDQNLSSYSSGMRARLGFSVALETDPDILLIDEALGVGDHEFKEKSSKVMKEWIRSDKTVLLVSHDTNSIANLCDRAIWIEHGQVAMDGKPYEVLERYHSYDRAVREIAIALDATENDVRNSPFGDDPIYQLEKFTKDIKEIRAQEKEAYLSKAGEGVQYYAHNQKSATSMLIEEHCGRTVWIEGIHQIQVNEGNIEQCYDAYSELVLMMAENLSQEVDSFREARIGRKLVDVIAGFNSD